MSLSTPISTLGGVYKRFSRPLEKLGIIRLEDFLYHTPFRYDDYSLISKIGRVQEGEIVTVRGEILEIKNQYARRFTIQRARIQDETGAIEAVWFNQPYIARNLTQGDVVSFSGKIERKGKLQISNPDFETGDENIHTGRLVPVYPETRGVSSKWMRRQIYKLLNENSSEIEDFLPEEILKRNKLPEVLDSLWKIHFPKTLEEASEARERLSFNELLLLHLSSDYRRKEWEKELRGFAFELKANEGKLNEFKKSLPFELTGAQEKSVKEILSDLEKEKPMNRLLEGDVGSGKTIVAAFAIYLTYLNGYQSVFMAPTEILANQHFETLSRFLTPFGVTVGIQTRSQKTKEKVDLLIGTHAVINSKFEKLGLIIIDEQQRFGVEQRGIMREKGKNPHVLTMTATPIPRTVALTMYGDLDLSVLDEMPKGRKEIKTWLVPNEKREGAYRWIEKQIKKNISQVFIICPFIEESESMTTVRAATKEFERLQKIVFKNLRITLLHGKMKSKDKDRILNEFKGGKYDILVATPLVEVGIDIPNADIILIEAAERFGLSQLHQLRGRVGRNDRQAYCLLFTESPNPLTNQRLKFMVITNIGSKLAEYDLELRGPGEIYGTSQHGRRFLKVASFSDFDLIKKTKEEATMLVDKLDKYPKLLEKVKDQTAKYVSPD
jgi:ATP-dependent DNA helicase RecG